MQYLVSAESLETGLLPPQQLAQILEHQIVPSVEALMKLEADGKVLAGGVVVGTRSAVFVVEAASNEEVTQVLTSLPFWGMIKWTVTPLESFKFRDALQRQMLEHLKAIA